MLYYIVSNIWFALLALLVLTSILHFLFVYPKNLSKKSWKKVDYVWISFTVIGLIGATNNVTKEFSKNKIAVASSRKSFQYNFMLSFLDSEDSHIVCRTFNRSEYSPENFDAIVADFDRCCKWSKDVREIVTSIDTVKNDLVDMTKIPNLQTVNNIWYKNTVLENIEEYNKIVSEKIVNENVIYEANNGSLLFFTPLFLILGLAIRITKVTGELRNEK
jgi:hypothetical protein